MEIASLLDASSFEAIFILGCTDKPVKRYLPQPGDMYGDEMIDEFDMGGIIGPSGESSHPKDEYTWDVESVNQLIVYSYHDKQTI